MSDFSFSYDKDLYRFVVGEQPHIFHCHHYNLFLQQTLLDAEYVDTIPILIGASAEVAHSQLTAIFRESKYQDRVVDPASRKALASEIYAASGFGTIDLSDCKAEGGTACAAVSHYNEGFIQKPSAEQPRVDFFTQGWVAGALAAIYDIDLGSFSSTVVKSLSDGADANTFRLSAESPNYPIYKPSSLGPVKAIQTKNSKPNSNVSRNKVRDAVLTLPLFGDERGLIEGFGVLLTCHYANYYNRLSFELLRTLSDKFGEEGYEISRSLLSEAGRVCGFFTFGGIFQSTEWDAVVRPQLQNQADWVHGMLGVVDAFGWGRWEVEELSSERAVFSSSNDYEACGYVQMYGETENHCSFLFEGGVLGLMTLVYETGISEPRNLTQKVYDETFHTGGIYNAEFLQTAADGNGVTRIRVSKN